MEKVRRPHRRRASHPRRAGRRGESRTGDTSDQSNHTSTVQLFIDGSAAGTLEVEFSVTFKIVAVRCVISQARLTAIETGRCTVTGAIAVDGNEMVKRQCGFDLPGAVRLRGGVPLLAPVAEATTATHAAEDTGQTLATTARWCADPTLRNQYRLWDGSRWTNRVSNNGRESCDPLSGLPRSSR